MAGHSTGHWMASAGLSEMRGCCVGLGKIHLQGLHRIPCSSFPTEVLVLYRRSPSPQPPLRKLLLPVATSFIFGALGLLEVSALRCAEINLFCFYPLLGPRGVHFLFSVAAFWGPRTRNVALLCISYLPSCLAFLCPCPPAFLS